MTTRTLDQERARHAWGAVQQALKLGEKEKKDYGREAKKLPVRILNSGLGPALLFLDAKKKAPGLQASLKSWIDERVKPGGGAPAGRDLLTRIREGDSRFLRHATAECLAYLQWLVRFAEAEGLKGDDQEP